MNTQKWIGVVIVIAVLVAGAYFIGQSSNNQTQPTGVTATQSAPQSPQAGNQTIPSSANQSQPQQKSLADITKEWQGSTAYVVCDWYYSDGTLIQELSGSGLLATLNSAPTIITNKHVVYNSTYGYTNRCEIKFPNDDGGYVYSSNDGSYPNYGSLTVDSNGNDVAYISGMHWVHLIGSDPSIYTYTPPSISLSERSKNNPFACSSSESTGDSVLVLGYPADGPQIDQFGSQTNPTVTEGIISGTDGIYYTTSAKIDHGNSGGLAIDETNDCYAGIPTWVVSDSLGSLGRILPVPTFLR